MTQSSTDSSLVERLRGRAAAEREIQRNNETVAAALAPQLENWPPIGTQQPTPSPPLRGNWMA